MILDDDHEWTKAPTALEAAHYDRLLKLQTSRSAQRDEEAAARTRRIFGECLASLIRLGMAEGKARAMLGKWRRDTPDDETLIGAINAAVRTNTPDPVSYVTGAIRQRSRKQDAVGARLSHEWVLIGWEAPVKTRKAASGPQWKHGARGQVWRDPFGKLAVLETPAGVTPPTLANDPGVPLT